MSQSNALRRSEAYAEPATQDFSIRPLAAVTGAEIVGIDLSRELAPADFAKVHRAHLDHHLLVFRDQRITPQQHIDFSRRFGRLMIHVLHQFHLPGHPEILIVSNIVEDGKPIGLATPASTGIRTSRTRNCPAWGRCCMRRNYLRKAATRCSPTCM